MEETLRTLTKQLWTLSNQSRLRIIEILQNQSGTTTATRIREATGFAQPTVSRHMKYLVEAGFVHQVPYTGYQGRTQQGYIVDNAVLESMLYTLQSVTIPKQQQK